MNDDAAPITKAELRRQLANLATKNDLALLATKEEIAKLATKEELAGLATKEALAAAEQRLDVQFEALRHDVLGALRDIQSLLRDKTTDHEQRIGRLERYTGFVA